MHVAEVPRTIVHHPKIEPCMIYIPSMKLYKYLPSQEIYLGEGRQAMDRLAGRILDSGCSFIRTGYE